MEVLSSPVAYAARYPTDVRPAWLAETNTLQTETDVRFSIREMMYVIALLAIGIGGTISGHRAAWAAFSIFAAIILANAIDVFVASGTRKQFAIGFMIPTFCYLTLLVMLGESEFDPNEWSQLPTSRVAQLLVRPAYTTHKDSTVLYEREIAGRNSMPLAHLFFATAIGYVGGSYARWSASRCQRIVSHDGG